MGTDVKVWCFTHEGVCGPLLLVVVCSSLGQGSLCYSHPIIECFFLLLLEAFFFYVLLSISLLLLLFYFIYIFIYYCDYCLFLFQFFFIGGTEHITIADTLLFRFLPLASHFMVTTTLFTLIQTLTQFRKLTELCCKLQLIFSLPFLSDYISYQIHNLSCERQEK